MANSSASTATGNSFSASRVIFDHVDSHLLPTWKRPRKDPLYENYSQHRGDKKAFADSIRAGGGKARRGNSQKDWAESPNAGRSAESATAGGSGQAAQVGADASLKAEVVAELNNEATGDVIELADVAAQTETVEVKGFTDEHAEAIFDDILGIKGWGEVLPAIKSRRGVKAILALGRNLIEQGRNANEVAVTLGTGIYEAYIQSGGSKKDFAKSLRTGVNQKRSGSAQEDGAESANTGRSAESTTAGSGGQAAQAGADASLKAKVEEAASDVNTNPSEAQKKSGNYKKGHVTIDGLDITIENPKGSTRSGVDKGNKPWSVTMPAHYGYVKGTEAVDGDQLDLYIGPNPDGATKVWVVDQINPAAKKFDEHKAMFGFNSQAEALAAYDAAFSDGGGPARRGAVTEMERDEFVDWVNEGGYESGALAYGKKARISRYRRVDRRGNSKRDEAETERVPQSLEQESSRDRISAAADVIRRVHRAAQASGEAAAGRPEEARRAVRHAVELKHAEEEALKEWASQNGLILDTAEFNQKWEQGGSISGAEHRAYPDGNGNWIKSNDRSLHSDWLEYFNRLELHSKLFPSTFSSANPARTPSQS